MIRKASFLLLTITCFCGASSLAQDRAAIDRLRVAHAQYYTPTASGLQSFRFEATIDWKAMLTRFGGVAVYSVWFDEPQRDADGDGPYRGGCIHESAMTLVTNPGISSGS